MTVVPNWTDHIESNEMLANAIEVVKIIEENGFEALIVGGSCRDIVLNNIPKDVDIAGNCPLDKIVELFPQTFSIGQSCDFNIVVVRHKGFDYEYAHYRGEKDYNGRKPGTVYAVDSFKEDAARRDLTMNSIGIRSNGSVIDHFNGIEDIYKREIRCVGCATDRFCEDGLRILRCIRFAAKLDFCIDSDTATAIEENLHILEKVSPERIREEIVKMASLTGEQFAMAVELMDSTGILEVILPELADLKNFPAGDFHPEADNNLEHVIAAIRMNPGCNPLVNLSLLFHDVAKNIVTYKKRFKRDMWLDTYYGHDEKAVPIIEEICERLRFPNAERDCFIFVARNHMRFHGIDKMKPFKVHKIISSPYFDVLREVSYCDDACRMHLFDENEYNRKMRFLDAQIADLKQHESLINSVNGKRVLELTGCKPGKIVGAVIETVRRIVMNTPVNDPEEIDKLIMNIYRSRKNDF